MQSVTCRFCSANFADLMIEVRKWLDHHQCIVDNFEYYKMVGDITVIEIDFARSADAFDFAADFHGVMALQS